MTISLTPHPGAEGLPRQDRVLGGPDAELIAESIAHIVWTASPAGATTYFNRQGTDYTGCPREANYDWDWVALVHPDDAGRAQRADDDALWERFKAAQDRFFEAKDEVVATENAELTANLEVKQALLGEAEALLPVTDLEAAKASLRHIQDRWDAAGKVPREEVSRIEGRLRKVEQSVRDLDDQRWQKSNPEVTARAQSMVDQLERAVQGLEQDLEAARATGEERRIAEAEQALGARREWLESARAGLHEFEG